MSQKKCPLVATRLQNARVLGGDSPYDNPNITNMKNFSDTLSDMSPTSPTQHFTSKDGVFNEASWDEKLVNKSYEWVEKLVVFKPPKVYCQVAVRDGLLEARVLPYNGFTYDHLYGTKIGGTIFYRKGHRHTTTNLLENAIGQLEHGSASRPQAYGVVFKDALGVFHKAYLMKNSKSLNEIILSAGAIGSPQLLMLSGIGPSDYLQAHGMKVVLDQPLVGQGMVDSPRNMLMIPSPIPVEVSLTQAVGITRFVPPNAMVETIETINAIAKKTFKGGVIVEKLQNINLKDNPAITFNYIKEPQDLRGCVLGMSTIMNVEDTYPFSKFRYSNMTMQALIDMMVSLQWNKRPQHPSAAFSLEQFCIDTILTMWHFHGCCQVGKVVDHDYKVFGVDALRVIDGSTFLQSPGTNPQATVMMLGRYMGEKILHEGIHMGGSRR
ncbi:hypothetical protein ACB092_12G080800 [Castanea dentata]